MRKRICKKETYINENKIYFKKLKEPIFFIKTKHSYKKQKKNLKIVHPHLLHNTHQDIHTPHV